jgi:hypothetical protein
MWWHIRWESLWCFWTRQYYLIQCLGGFFEEQEADDEKKNRDILQAPRGCDDIFDGNLYDASELDSTTWFNVSEGFLRNRKQMMKKRIGTSYKLFGGVMTYSMGISMMLLTSNINTGFANWGWFIRWECLLELSSLYTPIDFLRYCDISVLLFASKQADSRKSTVQSFQVPCRPKTELKHIQVRYCYCTVITKEALKSMADQCDNRPFRIFKECVSCEKSMRTWQCITKTSPNLSLFEQKKLGAT